MPTMWNERQLEIANRFTERVGEALVETGLARDQWNGFVLGWIYGQLRQVFTKEKTREIFEHAVEQCEAQLEDAGQS